MTSRLSHIDWDFSGDSCASVFSTVHWHPCRFVGQIPATLIGLLSELGETVLDPYCGSGTTLVEAQRLGRRPVGIDINPVAILTSKSKLYTEPAKTLAAGMRSACKHVLDKISDSLLSGETSLLSGIPATVQLQKWYHAETARELAALWSAIGASRSKYSEILYAAFSSILLSVCNETRHWGYICDNTQPKTTRRVDAVAAFCGAIDSYTEAYLERDRLLGKGVRLPVPEGDVLHGHAGDKLADMRDGSVDLIVTSPPYFGVCDYVKAQRLSMEWFGLDIEPFRSQETGARSKRHRNTALEEYVTEVAGVISECARVLKRGRYAAFVIGESAARASVVTLLGDALRAAGFETIIDVPRNISIQRRQNPSITTEYVLVGKLKK